MSCNSFTLNQSNKTRNLSAAIYSLCLLLHRESFSPISPMSSKRDVSWSQPSGSTGSPTRKPKSQHGDASSRCKAASKPVAQTGGACPVTTDKELWSNIANDAHSRSKGHQRDPPQPGFVAYLCSKSSSILGVRENGCHKACENYILWKTEELLGILVGVLWEYRHKTARGFRAS